MPRIGKYLNNDEFLHLVATMFYVQQKSPAEIKTELGKLPEYAGMTSSTVYFVLSQLHSKGIVTYHAQRDHDLEELFIDRFDFRHSEIRIVRSPGDVPTVAGQIAAELLVERWTDMGGSNRRPLGLGLGPGRTTAEMARELGRNLEFLPHVRLKLFALSGGAPVTEPEASPISFFSAIPDTHVDARVGLFAPNLVEAGQYQRLISSPGIVEAYERRHEIYLCVTSMGDAGDANELLARFLTVQSPDALARIKAKGYVGNVQYRPYADTGPIEEDPEDYRAVTLFEYADLVQRAGSSEFHTILMARNKSRAAMMPLIRERSTRPFTHLVIDRATADRILQTSQQH